MDGGKYISSDKDRLPLFGLLALAATAFIH